MSKPVLFGIAFALVAGSPWIALMIAWWRFGNGFRDQRDMTSKKKPPAQARQAPLRREGDEMIVPYAAAAETGEEEGEKEMTSSRTVGPHLISADGDA